jgi:hypothetical protein
MKIRWNYHLALLWIRNVTNLLEISGKRSISSINVVATCLLSRACFHLFCHLPERFCNIRGIELKF